MTATRRLAAILAADVAGFTSLIEADLGGTLRALKAIRRDLVEPTIEAHNGRLLKTSGDLLLVEFSNVVEALRCATDLQKTVVEHNRNLPAGKRIEFGSAFIRGMWSFRRLSLRRWGDYCYRTRRRPGLGH